jgi:hypothetical protein
VKPSDNLGAFFHIARLASEGPTCQGSPSPNPPKAPPKASEAHPETNPRPPFPLGGTPLQASSPKDLGNHMLAKGLLTRGLWGTSQACRGVVYGTSDRQAELAVRVVTVETHPTDDLQEVPVEMVDQGIVTALQLGVALDVPCCSVRIQGPEANTILHVQTCVM